MSEYETPEPELCLNCRGSGEGMADGERCSQCNGRGVLPERDSDD